MYLFYGGSFPHCQALLGKTWKKFLDNSLPLHALIILLLFIGTSVLFITTPASHHVSHSVFLSLGGSGIDINIVWMIPNWISQVYCSGFCSIICEWERMNKESEHSEREKKRRQLQPPSWTSVAQRVYKFNQRLVSQTALEGIHCDCENDWDLINSLHRLCKVHICLFRNRLLRINQLRNRKGNSLCGWLQRRTAYKRCCHYFKCFTK